METPLRVQGRSSKVVKSYHFGSNTPACAGKGRSIMFHSARHVKGNLSPNRFFFKSFAGFRVFLPGRGPLK